MLVVMSGLPGTGKSEIAGELGRQLEIPVFSVDPIESAILSAGIEPSFHTGLAAYLVAEALAEARLSAGQSAIVDAVNGVEPAKALWRRLASRYATDLRIVECRCSEEALHRSRLRDRRRGLAPNFPEPTWEVVERCKREYTNWTEPVFAVDSALPCDANAAAVVAWLRL